MSQRRNESAACVDYEELAAELAKIPKRYLPQIFRDTAVFIADMTSIQIAAHILKQREVRDNAETQTRTEAAEERPPSRKAPLGNWSAYQPVRT